MKEAGLVSEESRWTSLETDLPGARFALVCASYPGRTALCCGLLTMTYAELDRAAEGVAAGLAAKGVGAGDLVGICLGRSLEMIVAMLSVVKAGAAYLPLDAGYPLARLKETIADAAPALVIVGRESELEGVAYADLTGTWKPQEHARAESTAYVIYTSGSTGKPKGVQVSNANLMALLRGTAEVFDCKETDVWTMFHSFAFDFSVWEIWGCLLTGGRLVIVPFETSRAPEEFRQLLVNEQVTILNQTPSAFALLDRADAAAITDGLALRYVIFGGEALAGTLLRGWFRRRGDRSPALVNMYGITETTVHVTFRRMTQADATEHESLLGSALPGWTLHLLDEAGAPCDEGEIWVGGAGVAKGYLGRPELTAERFVAGRYRSGDMARRRADGELVYLGRRDGQVKVNGFRMELGEIEAALQTCAGVEQACVAVKNCCLVAYLVAGAELKPGAELANKLPRHMLPSQYVKVSGFPLNANGKVDRAALPEPGQQVVVPALTGTAMEKEVAALWSRVVGSQVGMDDNFFDVGGTSLLLIAVRTGLQEKLGLSVPVTWMFECTTIRTLAKRLEHGVEKVAVSSNAERQRQAFARARKVRGAAR